MRRHMKAVHSVNISTKELIEMFRKNMGRYARQDLQKLNELIENGKSKQFHVSNVQKTN